MLARSVFARNAAVVRVNITPKQVVPRCSRGMATEAFSSLRTKFARAKRGDSRMEAIEEDARKSVVVALTTDEKLLQDALRDSKTEEAPRIRALVKATVNGALRALYDGADAQKLRQINPSYDFEVPAFEPQTMRETLMKRVLEAAVVEKVEEQMHPRTQLFALANREGEALVRKILAAEAGRGSEVTAAQQDAERAAAARRVLVEYTLKNQPEAFTDDKQREAFENFNAGLDKGSITAMYDAARKVETPSRQAERARLEKDIQEQTQELLRSSGVNLSKIKAPTTTSNNFYGALFPASDIPLPAAK